MNWQLSSRPGWPPGPQPMPSASCSRLAAAAGGARGRLPPARGRPPGLPPAPRARAARALLRVGAGGGAAERMPAASLAQAAGPDGEPLWREALGNPVLWPYAKLARHEVGRAPISE